MKNMNSHAPKYVIMYAGNAHSINYREFLKLAGFQSIYGSSTSWALDNCLDIRNLPPLFPEYM